jgi:hypothetical protein
MEETQEIMTNIHHNGLLYDFLATLKHFYLFNYVKLL